MDRFKFRVWDSEAKQYQNTSGFAIYADGVLVVIDHIDEMAHEVYEAKECLIVEQCTGLKDKKGKLVFVGDIIRVKIPKDKVKENWYRGEKDGVFQITDDVDGFGVYCFDFDPISGYDCITHIINYGFEVIGNIHEQAAG